MLVPFLIAYGLGIYLVAGTVSTAFSGPTDDDGGGLAIGRALPAPAAGPAGLPQGAQAAARAALERSPALRPLLEQGASIGEVGAWTPAASPDGSRAAGTGGVALTLELARPADLDLAALPGADLAALTAATPAERIAEGVSALLVLYDAAHSEIVAAHPAPARPPLAPSHGGRAPEAPRG